MHKTILKCTLIVAVVGCSALFVPYNVNASSQPRNQDLLSTVPVEHRTRLKGRLNLLIKYQRAKRWDRMYDVLRPSIIRGRSREDYANQRQEWELIPPISTLLSFAPIEVVTTHESANGGEWYIVGCARYRRKGRILQIRSAVEAQLQNSEWFFTEIFAATQVDGSEKACSMPKQSSLTGL